MKKQARPPYSTAIMSDALDSRPETPPASPSLPAEASPKRRAILHGAAALFLEEGFAAVSMDAVARAAGVSKATLYAHFPGKDALFTEIVAQKCLAMQTVMDGAVADHSYPLEQSLALLGRHWLSYLLQPKVRALHRMVVAESGRSPDLAWAFYRAGPQRLQAWLQEWLEGERARGRLRAEAPVPLVADQFFALLRGHLFTRATLGLPPEATPAEIEAQAREAARAIQRLYGVAPEAPDDVAPEVPDDLAPRAPGARARPGES
ncbi:TetR/AcrR family transcriptional regulator [Roseomonas sp. GC11]|uniref:TetR/AcrR family transcriptional regulator n=1 Tax=Roseomonas sp. GC11 TaxID=2950546 RepID=UPI00210A7019|nr:TetR/AcrR family transcriptional regulator [Roseomonas sp. GC11]MCQ4161181.1 TetR/AcrR family transcriptional regulator [Roseomonas sp. GC11]